MQQNQNKTTQIVLFIEMILVHFGVLKVIKNKLHKWDHIMVFFIGHNIDSLEHLIQEV